VLWAVGPLALLVNLPFLRGIAEAGRIVEHAGVAAAGQAATVAVAAVVIAVPAASPAVVSGIHSPETHARTSAAPAPGRATPPVALPAGGAPVASHARVAAFRQAGSAANPVVRVTPPTQPAKARPAEPGPPAPARPSTQPPAAAATAAPAEVALAAAADATLAAAAAPTTPVVASTTLVRTAAAPVAFTVSAPVSLGTAASFAVLAGSTITNTGNSTITGDLGLSPGTAVTGVLAGVLNGSLLAANGASPAKVDLASAYDNVAARRTTKTIPVELGGTTQTPGVYDSAAGTFGITGSVTLDAQGDPDAVFIFKAASTLITASGSRVKLLNGARASNVFWLVGSSATLGTFSVLRGSVLALTSITVTTGVTVDGRMLARNGAVTLDSDVINCPAVGQ
jgi:hypothetical protein